MKYKKALDSIVNDGINLGAGDYVDLDALKIAADVLKKVISGELVPVVRGVWEGTADGYADGELVYDVWDCSECGYCIDDGTDDPDLLPKYCPNCGAKMDGGL